MHWKATQRTPRTVTGFTLVELLVVVSIIALLVAILLPSLKRARNQAKDVVCRSNLHQLGVSVNYYISDNRDRLPWIKGSKDESTPPQYNRFPFRQYHQIFLLFPYLKDLSIYQCPRAKSVERTATYGPSPLPGGRPGSTTGYNQGKGETIDGVNYDISYYAVLKADQLFLEAHERRYFPNVNPFDPVAYPGKEIPELHTEYWFNDWNEGAGSIPAISGNLVNNIPFPELAVMFTDAIDWNPRHNGGNSFLFLDTHVEHYAQKEYFDPKGAGSSSPAGYQAKDKDPHGNHPYWAWGLGHNIKGY